MLFAQCSLLGMFFHLLPDPKVKALLSSRARLFLWAKWRMSGTKLWLKSDTFSLEMPVSTSIPKRNFSLIRLIILMGWYCSISQGKVLVLDSLIFANIWETLPSTSCKWCCNRISLKATKDRLPASHTILKVALLRWSPCNFPHMGPKTPDALRSV